QHRAQSHNGRIERRPLAVDDHGARGEAVLLDGRLGGEDDPGCAVGNLRAVAWRHLAPWPLERGLELGERLYRGVRPHPVIEIVDLAVAAERRLELTGKAAVGLRARELELALDRV